MNKSSKLSTFFLFNRYVVRSFSSPCGKKVQKGYNVSVISTPSWELFENQSQEYQESVLASCNQRRLTCELGATFGWQKYVAQEGAVVGIAAFGTSGPGEQSIEHFGFTVKHIVEQTMAIIDANTVVSRE
ncbi:transketolase-like TK C-terminal-containing protein [Heyndrickxia faecalis]|uniref:transketolase-like TK C-terminal-containing protein n=1 Tax=Heyndrickxia faecalis TaxID=2824910 RepID=UPI003D23E759